MRNQEFVLAHWAAEKFLARNARDTPERRQTSFFNPAAGTHVSAAAFDPEIRKALLSSCHRITFRLYFRYFLLSLHKTVLNIG